MITPGSAHALLLSRTGGYTVPYSLRFREQNNGYLSRTSGASPTSKRTFTYSAWIKAAPSLSSSTQIALVSSSANNGMIGWNIVSFGGRLFIRNDAANDIQFSGLFRDSTAWGHLVVAIDTTQATSSNRVKVYWNGVAMTYLSGTYPTLNYDSYLNAASTAYRIMSDTVNGTYVDGYLAEMHFIDGQALTPSSFGQSDSATGVWVPKKYAGTYGNNGFYLKFADASAATATAIGKDSSGNGNNWTPNNISVTSGVTFDQMLDTPTTNYCVLNQLEKFNGYMQDANLRWGINAGSARRGTFGMRSGKWYFECAITAGTNPEYFTPGIQPLSGAILGYGGTTQVPSGYGYLGVNGNKVTGTTGSAYGSAFTTNDVISVAFDADAGKIWFAKNGTWQASGDPAAGTNPAFSSIATNDYFPYVSNQTTSNNDHFGYVNFGQRSFSYTPPSGFKALNTDNLSTPSIKKGSLYMDATLRTGTGATASVSTLGFQPDLVWIKSRSAATDHGLYDAVRGVQKQLESNTTTAETTETTGLTAFNSNGYTVGTLAQLNTNTATYVDWAWRKTLTAGFDIMTYTGNGVSGRTVSHSLGVTPAMVVVKNRSTAGAFWSVAHKSLTAGYNLLLNDTTGQFLPGNAAYGGISAFNSSTFTVVTGLTDQRNVNTNGDSYVAYLWSEIEGFSKFGSYTGNGSTDGPFVWCGFRPRYILVKRTDVANDWCIADSARPAFNPAYNLRANLADIEDTTQYNTDLVSNGFKIRNTTNGMNGSGATYIFAAFAENPFKYARAR